VFPSLAKAIGLNQALVLQQLQFWLHASGHEKEGRRWVFNTYDQWQKEFPWWTTRTIQSLILRLEQRGFVLSTAKFNAHPMDKTKWYSINHEALYQQIPEPEPPSRQKEQMVTNLVRDGHESASSSLTETSKKETSKKEKEGETPVPESEWYATLLRIGKVDQPEDKLLTWLDSNAILPDHAETTAHALEGRWDGKRYKNVRATFQSWVKRPPLSTNNVKPHKTAEERSEERRAILRREHAQDLAETAARAARKGQ
jgi:hypothetical protein